MSKKMITYYPKGNFQSLRTAYFQFRAHCKRFAKTGGKEGIDYRKLTTTEANFLKHQIGTQPEWSAMDAFKLRGILAKFDKEMAGMGIDVDGASQDSGFIEVLWHKGLFRVRPFSINQSTAQEFRKQIGFMGLVDRGGVKEWQVGIEQAGKLLSFIHATQCPIRIEEEVKSRLQSLITSYRLSYGSERVTLDIPLRSGIQLRDYQTVGVAYHLNKGRSLNADTMGLGKTIQAIASMVGRERFPALIVCPKSLRLNWLKEIHQFSYRRAVLLDKRNVGFIRELKQAGIDFFITNYEGVASLLYKRGQKGLLPKSALYEFRAVCFDEAHELKNQKTRKYKTCSLLANSSEDALLLTGTPIVNKASDVWALIELLRKQEEFGGEKYFMREYDSISADSFEGHSKDMAKLRRLNKQLRTSCMIRREKHEVLKELPPKSRIVVQYQMDSQQAEEYAMKLGQFKQWAKKTMQESENKVLASNASLVKLNELGKLLATFKAGFIGEMARSIISQGEQVVIFAWHHATLEALKKHLPQMHEISGRVSDENINRSVEQFQAGKVKVLGITYKRGSMGLTLTKASKWIAAEMGWTAKDQEQAEDRIHRIGQAMAVECYYPLAVQTVDQYRYSVIESKKAIFAGAVDSTAEKHVTSASQNAMAVLEKILAE